MMRYISILPLIFPYLVTTNPLPSSVDIVVIGAGLSGIITAHELLKAGKSVLVLEARSRVGGKVRNQWLHNGGVTEVGAEFVGPTKDKVLQTISI